MAVEVDIELWKITVYDCDSTVCDWKAMSTILKTWEDLLPSLLHASGEFPTNNQIMALEMKEVAKLPRMHSTRVGHDLVPKATKR